MSLCEGRQCMALLIALGVGATGILVAFGCGICRFYRTSGRRDSVAKKSGGSGEKRRLIDDSSEEDNYGSKGELSKGESSKEESGPEEYVKGNKAKDSAKKQTSPHRKDDDETVHDFGPLPKDKGTYILSPVHTATPTKKPKPQSEPEEVKESSVSTLPTSGSPKHSVEPEEPVTPPEIAEKPVTPLELKEKSSEEKLDDEVGDKEEAPPDNSSTDDVLTPSNSDQPSHDMIPLIPVGLAEKIAQRKIKDASETEGEALQSPPPSVAGGAGAPPSSVSPDGSLKLPPPVAPKPKSKPGEAIQSPVSPQPTSESCKSPKAAPVKPGGVVGSDRDEDVAEGKQTGRTGSRSKASPVSPAMFAQSTSSKTPNRPYGIQVMPMGLAEKLSARKKKVEKEEEDKSTEGTSETLNVVERDSESFLKTASFDDPVQKAPLRNPSRNKGPARRPPSMAVWKSPQSQN